MVCFAIVDAVFFVLPLVLAFCLSVVSSAAAPAGAAPYVFPRAMVKIVAAVALTFLLQLLALRFMKVFSFLV